MKVRWESELAQIGDNQGQMLWCRVPSLLFKFQFAINPKVVHGTHEYYDSQFQNIFHSILKINNALPPGTRLACEQDDESIPDSSKILARDGKCLVLKNC